MAWLPIIDEIKDGREVLVGYCQATVSLVRLASWDDGDYWEQTGFDSAEQKRGWWSYDNCVGAGKVPFEPTHYMEIDEVPDGR